MHHLTAAGVSFVLADGPSGRPVVLHWGAALTPDSVEALASTHAIPHMANSLDTPSSPSVAASGADGWSGAPAFEWHADGVVPAALTGATTVEGDAVVVALTEPRTGGEIVLRYRLLPDGVLQADAELTNTGSAPIDLRALRLLLPVPDRAREVLDFTGAWSDERRAQRRALADGTWTRTNRRGRGGHDAATLTAVGTPAFTFRSGEVWAAHVAFSGGVETVVDRLPEGAGSDGALLGGGEAPAAGEIRLAPGERYTSPSVFFVWSDRGLDGLAARLHARARSFPAYPTRPRPLVLNSWEAVYFDHSLDRLLPLVDAAARVGVERFVLDDGWFLGRRDDTTGLGDWFVDPAVWPDGLRPLSDAVHAAGMEFGLWFEPEMVNPGSMLAREHPEWVLADDQGTQPLSRHQQGLNLGDPDCYAEVLHRIDAVVAEAGVDYIKWDMNRDLHEAVDRRTHRAGVHAHTLAVYRMMDALRDRHPALEIESCASGGGRVDLGVLQHAQRVWTSDTIDPLERQRIQEGTELLVPLGVMGTHVGGSPAHTTDRSTSLPFRMATALFGHAGIEWDLTALGEGDLAAVAAWAALYKEQRELLHTGDVVHGDAVPDGARLRGVVDRSRDRALFQLAQLETGRRAADPRTPLPGLDPERTYRLGFREEFGRASRRSREDPAWCEPLSAPGGSVDLPGALLTGPGVPLPALQPAAALLIEAVALP